MSGYYGQNLDKKELIYVLDNGLAFCADQLKKLLKQENINSDEFESIKTEMNRLYEMLYTDADNIIPLSYLVKFENRYNSNNKRIEKIEQKIK